MYLALLAGGQIIKKIVKKSLGTSSDEGFSMFEFESVSRNEAKALVIDTINKLELTREQKDAIIQEKIDIFGMNNDIVNGIKPKLGNYKRLAKLLLALITLIFLILYLAYCIIF